MQNSIYNIKLFIAGNESNSLKAKDNLYLICEKYLTGRYNIEVIDILKNFQIALDYDILVTPMVIFEGPETKINLIGNLSNQKAVLDALGLK